MGGFLLAPRDDGAFDRALGAMRDVGFCGGRILERDDYRLGLFPKFGHNDLDLIEFEGGDFICATGSLIYSGRTGEAALLRFFRDYLGGERPTLSAYGQFAIVLRKDGQTRIMGDDLGAYEIFVDPKLRLCATSFLAMIAGLDRCRVSVAAVYEFVFNGVVSGDATLSADVSRLPGGAVLNVGQRKILQPQAGIAPSVPRSRADYLGDAMRRLDDYFSVLSKLFGDRVSCALSGGYDSRLLLAMLRRHGIQPRLFVYGRPQDPDVVLASHIAEGEKLPIERIDKSRGDLPPVAVFPMVVEANYLAADGLVWGGLFTRGVEIDERRRRTGNEAINLNGGGGECLRDFFRLPDRPIALRAFLWSFYAQFDPRVCTGAFREDRYYQGLEDKIRQLTGKDGGRLARHEVEWLYHRFRCRSWDGRANSLNLRHGHSVLPFLEPGISGLGYRIPVGLKQAGAFEAELIRIADPRLAGYRSDYGHDFSGPPPLRKRLGEALIRLRPPALRRYTWRIKHRRRPASDVMGGLLAEPYQRAVFPDGLRHMRQLFNIDQLRDPMQMQRILSVEYLCQREKAELVEG